MNEVVHCIDLWEDGVPTGKEAGDSYERDVYGGVVGLGNAIEKWGGAKKRGYEQW